jgi:hypothetical protein
MRVRTRSSLATPPATYDKGFARLRVVDSHAAFDRFRIGPKVDN